MSKEASATFILPCMGSDISITAALFSSLWSMKSLVPKHEVILCCDGPQWGQLQTLHDFCLPLGFKVLTLTKESHLPSRLFNLGIANATHKYICFVLPGMTVSSEYVQKNIDYLADQEPEVAGLFSKMNLTGLPSLKNFFFGWLQMYDLIDFNGCIFRKCSLNDISDFDESPALQLHFGWDIFLRLSKFHILKSVPYTFVDTENKYLRLRPLKTFRYSESQRRNYLVSKRDCINLGQQHKQKVAVISGWWDFIHNQILFFSYFDTDRGQADFSWHPLADSLVEPEDIESVDTVIISRARDPKVRRIVDFCIQKNIPVIYVIDDNWLTAAEEVPGCKEQFSQGDPSFDTFIYCLKNCHATLVHFSETLAHHVSKVAKKLIFYSKVGINLGEYNFPPRNKKNRKIIGYAGSIRKNDAAFAALAKFVINFTDWHLIYFGNEIHPSIKDLNLHERLIFYPYESYFNYAKRIVELGPDILIAPLDQTEFSKSKCPNKFFEITASGAAGIYSGFPPYIHVIENNKSGILISPEQNNEIESWYNAMCLLSENPALRKSIQTEARQLIVNEYNPMVNYQDFLDLMKSLHRQNIHKLFNGPSDGPSMQEINEKTI